LSRGFENFLSILSEKLAFLLLRWDRLYKSAKKCENIWKGRLQREEIYDIIKKNTAHVYERIGGDRIAFAGIGRNVFGDDIRFDKRK
jgi:predicted glycosyltransferase involved in capsule biosynthesis